MSDTETPTKVAVRKPAARKTAAKKSTAATASAAPAPAKKRASSTKSSSSATKKGTAATKESTADSGSTDSAPQENQVASNPNREKSGQVQSTSNQGSSNHRRTSHTTGGKNQNGSNNNAKNNNSRNGNNNRQQKKNNNNGGGSNNNNFRRPRRQHNPSQGNREPVVPKTTAEDLNKLKVTELREKATELGIDSKGLLKAELVKAVFDASIKKEGFIDVEGVLDILADGYGFLRTNGYLPSEHDVYVGLSMIRRNGLRKGDYVKGQVRPARDNEKYAALQKIADVNGVPVDQMGRRPRFADLTPVYPDERLLMEHGRSAITARVIDLAAPIGKGQRGLIVSPPKAGKTTVLKDIAASISANNPEVHLMCLLVDERPEEVTDMERSIKGEVVSSTFDMPSENHIAVAEMVIERAKRLVEKGDDVVILLDSITRLARAYNLAQPASGRILSGGVDSTALYPPKRFLGAARNIENGGSLTILASALIDTGSKMDEVIFEEFKGTGNMELKLDRNLADRRIFPAIDPVSSGTRKEDLLLDPQEAPLIWAVRRILSNMSNTERAMDMLIKSLKQTETNQEFLLRTAKKAQSHRADENFEL